MNDDQWIACSILIPQFLIASVLLFLPFGFDKPSQLGLDIGHFLLLLAIWAIILVLGLIVAAYQRMWRTMAVQVTLPIVTWCAIIALGK